MALTFPTLAQALDPADHVTNIAVTWDAVIGQQKIYIERDNLTTGEKKYWDGDSWEDTPTAITTTSATRNLTTATFSVDNRYRLTIWHLETDLDLISKTVGDFYVLTRPTLTVDAPSGSLNWQVPHVEWTSSGSQEAYRVWVWANSLLPGDIHDFDPDSPTYVDSGWLSGGLKEWWDNAEMAFNLTNTTGYAAVVQVRNVHNNYSHYEKSTFGLSAGFLQAAPTVTTTDNGGGIVKIELAAADAVSTKFLVWALTNTEDIFVGELTSLSDGTLDYYAPGLPAESITFDVVELVEGGPVLSQYGGDAVTLVSTPLFFTIAAEGGEPITVRQASLEIVHEGAYVGTPFKIAARNRPVVTYGAWGDTKRFSLRLRIHSRAEYDAAMAVLQNGERIIVTTHHGDVHKVALTGPITATSVKASPFAGEPYPTRFAWDLECQVTQNGED